MVGSLREMHEIITQVRQHSLNFFFQTSTQNAPQKHKYMLPHSNTAVLINIAVFYKHFNY